MQILCIYSDIWGSEARSEATGNDQKMPTEKHRGANQKSYKCVCSGPILDGTPPRDPLPHRYPQECHQKLPEVTRRGRQEWERWGVASITHTPLDLRPRRARWLSDFAHRIVENVQFYWKWWSLNRIDCCCFHGARYQFQILGKFHILTPGSFDSVSFHSKKDPNLKIQNFGTHFDQFWLQKWMKWIGKFYILKLGSFDSAVFDFLKKPNLKIWNFGAYFDRFW